MLSSRFLTPVLKCITTIFDFLSAAFSSTSHLAFCTMSVCSIWSRFVTKVIFGSMLRVYSDRGSIQKQAGSQRGAFIFCGWISRHLDTHVDKLAGQYVYAVLQVRNISIMCLFYSTLLEKDRKI